jgi:hypothetical protein
LFGKPERKRPLGRPIRRWENNVRMDLREMGSEVVDWIHLAQDRNQWWALVNTVMNPSQEGLCPTELVISKH